MYATRPSREEFPRYAAEGNLVPVVAEFFADRETPVTAYSKLAAAGPSFLFESVEGGESVSRYSFLGANPRLVLTAGEGETHYRYRDGHTESVPTPEDPLRLVEEEVGRYRAVLPPGTPPFPGGAVGFLAYEYVHRLEPTVPRPGPEPADTPVLCFLFIDEVVVFDRARQTLLLCACAHLEQGEDPLHAYDRALARIRTLHEQLDRPAAAPLLAVPEVPVPGLPPSNFARPAFERAVADAREYVHAGDVVQVVLSQRFEREYTRPPMDLYRALRTVNPSPYMVLFEAEDFAIVGASPEVHVRLTGDRVEIRPIAGTRPRGSDEEEDHAQEEDLLADPKEKAEHLMLVDLARNDIGRVCAPGSVHVPEFMGIERYSHVMHIVSQVEGTLAPGCNAFDLMRATFPAGTVSGAPKVRALQIIAEKEPGPRGPYSGALGYFAYGGNHDSCIAIRSAVLRDGRIRVQAGAGIVADSVPESEWQETVNKARGLLKAVALSEIVGS